MGTRVMIGCILWWPQNLIIKAYFLLKHSPIHDGWFSSNSWLRDPGSLPIVPLPPQHPAFMSQWKEKRIVPESLMYEAWKWCRALSPPFHCLGQSMAPPNCEESWKRSSVHSWRGEGGYCWSSAVSVAVIKNKLTKKQSKIRPRGKGQLLGLIHGFSFG